MSSLLHVWGKELTHSESSAEYLKRFGLPTFPRVMESKTRSSSARVRFGRINNVNILTQGDHLAHRIGLSQHRRKDKGHKRHRNPLQTPAADQGKGVKAEQDLPPFPVFSLQRLHPTNNPRPTPSLRPRVQTPPTHHLELEDSRRSRNPLLHPRHTLSLPTNEQSSLSSKKMSSRLKRTTTWIGMSDMC